MFSILVAVIALTQNAFRGKRFRLEQGPRQLISQCRGSRVRAPLAPLDFRERLAAITTTHTYMAASRLVVPLEKELPMPRKPSADPSLHKPSGWWYIYVNRKRKYLSKDFAEARRKARAERLAQVSDEPIPQFQKPKSKPGTFDALSREYLADLKIRRPKSYEGQFYRLRRAKAVMGQLYTSEVKRFHLAKLQQALQAATIKQTIVYKQTKKRVTRDTGKPYSPTTIRDTLAAVQNVFGWAVRMDLIDSNPLAGYRKPAAKQRTRVISDAEFRALLRVSLPCFRRFLLVLKLTGCRPSELRRLTWQSVLEDRLVFADHKSASQLRQHAPRIVPLCRTAQRLLERIATHHPTQRQSQVSKTHTGLREESAQSHRSFVFLNSRNQPWTKDTVVHAMDRARKRAGIQLKDGEKLVLYSSRHRFGTDATKKLGLWAASKLLGHSTTRMSERYSHSDVDYLIELRAKLTDDPKTRRPSPAPQDKDSPTPRPKTA